MPEPPERERRAELQAPIAACARGELPANVALAQAAIAAPTPEAVAEALARSIAELQAAGRVGQADRLRRAQALWAAAPGAWQSLTGVFGAAGQRPVGGTEEEAIADWSARFDQAAQISPVAGVALYSLGREDLLEAASEEIAAYMRERGLLGDQRVAVEIGCGIGRLLRTLSGELRLVIGLDVSPRMLAEAGRRCCGRARIALLRSFGRDLAAFRDGCVDLVYAVDAFPYLVDAGEAVAARHLQDASRILRARGALLILNYSYRGDLAADRADVVRFAQAHGFTVVENGTAPFACWDGRAFLLRKDPGP